MLQRVQEQIRVGAVFGPGPCIHPVWFDWRPEGIKNVDVK